MNDVEIKENCVVQFIDKDEIIETMQDCKYANPCNDFQRGVNACIDIQIVGIKHMPAADVVEVVRCKDCKHSYFVKSCSKYECRKGCGTLKYSNDFCSYGERKE